MSATPKERRRSTINVARLTMWKQTSDTADATAYETEAYTWENSLAAVKYTPKMQTNEQYGDGVKVEDFIAKDGGNIDITVNGFGAGDAAFLFGETNTNGTEISSANDIVPSVCVAYYTKRPDGKLNLYKFPKTKFMPEGEDSKQQEGTNIAYGTANLKGTYSPLLSTGDDCYKRYGVDPKADSALIEQWFPKPEKNVVPRPQSPENEEFSFMRLRALICDVMGKSEEFFWNSTLAELIARWHEYAVAMGYAEEPERILEFDVEGM